MSLTNATANDYYDPLVYVIPSEEDGWLLKTILRNRMHISRSLLARLKRTEQGIKVNGERVYVSARVRKGDRVEVRMEQETSDHILPQPLPLHIIYEDQHVMIVNKEAGMIVHPTLGHYTDTLANGTVHHWQQLGVKHRFRPVHRLDQYTSGVLAIAKTPYADHILTEQIKNQQFQRHYLALVHGIMADDEGSIVAAIDRDPNDPHKRMTTPSGYEAVTHYTVLARFEHAAEKSRSTAAQDIDQAITTRKASPNRAAQEGMTMVKLTLETGRTHQIRVHLAHLGHPLLGDDLYGIANDPFMSRQALHAVQLAFVHPITGEHCSFEAPLPSDMSEAVEQFMKISGECDERSQS